MIQVIIILIIRQFKQAEKKIQLINFIGGFVEQSSIDKELLVKGSPPLICTARALSQ